MTIKAWLDIRTGTGEVVKNFKLLWERGEKYFGGHAFRKFKKLFKKLIRKFFLKKMTSVPCFRIWGRFLPFRVLGFGVIFRRSMF